MQPHQPDQLHLLLQFRFRHGLEFPDGVVHALGSHLAGGKFHFPCANEFFNHAVFLPHRIQAFPDDGLAALGNGQLAPGLVQGTEKIQFRLAEGPEVRLLVLFRHLFFQGGKTRHGNGEAQAAGHVERIFLEDLFNIPGKGRIVPPARLFGCFIAGSQFQACLVQIRIHDQADLACLVPGNGDVCVHAGCLFPGGFLRVQVDGRAVIDAA